MAQFSRLRRRQRAFLDQGGGGGGGGEIFVTLISIGEEYAAPFQKIFKENFHFILETVDSNTVYKKNGKRNIYRLIIYEK